MIEASKLRSCDGESEDRGYLLILRLKWVFVLSLSEITSVLYLGGLNRSQFRRAIDNILQTNPSGRFPDPSALMTQLQAWKIANSLSFADDETSLQGSALVAAKTLSAPKPRPTTNSSKPKTPHLYPSPCTWCLAVDKVSRFGHLSSHCSKKS